MAGTMNRDSRMSVELGHFCLVLALALVLVQSIVPLIGAWRGDARLMAVGSNTALAAFAMVALSFRRADAGLCDLRLFRAERF